LKRVEFTPGAKRDLARLEDFLIDKSRLAAAAAARAISDAALSLSELPERGRLLDGGPLREIVARFGRDGYVIRYRVLPEAVVILRVFHGREHR
jgi:plasmid stabilization system protein ParE